MPKRKEKVDDKTEEEKTEPKNEEDKTEPKGSIGFFSPPPMDDGIPFIPIEKIVGEIYTALDYSHIKSNKFGPGLRLDFLANCKELIEEPCEDCLNSNGKERNHHKTITFSEIMKRQLEDSKPETPFDFRVVEEKAEESGMIYYTFATE